MPPSLFLTTTNPSLPPPQKRTNNKQTHNKQIHIHNKQIHRLERDPEVKASLSGANALDLMLEGYAFRASIALPKEVTLLEEAWAAARAGGWVWYMYMCVYVCICMCVGGWVRVIPTPLFWGRAMMMAVAVLC